MLKSDPSTRTEEDIRLIVVGLGQTVSSFTGFYDEKFIEIVLSNRICISNLQNFLFNDNMH
jgi:hypothetical protein